MMTGYAHPPCEVCGKGYFTIYPKRDQRTCSNRCRNILRYAERPVKTLAEVVSEIYAKTHPEGGCLIMPKPRGGVSYPRKSFQGKPYNAHSLVAQYYLGARPEGMEVRHLCGRGEEGCVTASHLKYGTRRENAMDKHRHGTFNVGTGERHRSAKLTEDIVRYCREVHIPRCPEFGARALSRRFGVNHSVMIGLLKGKYWSHVIPSCHPFYSGSP